MNSTVTLEAAPPSFWGFAKLLGEADITQTRLVE
jgi:hypothetical protein